MISTDRLIFEEGSAVRQRQISMAEKTEETHIVVFAKNGNAPREAALSTKCFVYSTASMCKFTYPLGAMRLGGFIVKRRKINSITCQDPFLTAMAGINLKKRFDLPLEIQLHTDIGSPNYSSTIGNRIRKAMALSHLRHADRIRVVSGRIKNYVVSIGIQASKIEVRPIAVDTNFFANAPIKEDLKKKYPQFSKIVLMASRLEREKNIELTLNAWPIVLKSHPSVGLVIVGDGSRKGNLKALVLKLGIEKSVIFENWADKSLLASYYKTADIFLNTSLYEGYGMTLVEAKSAGCKKIVSTDVGIAEEVGVEIVSWNKDSVSSKICDFL